MPVYFSSVSDSCSYPSCRLCLPLCTSFPVINHFTAPKGASSGEFKFNSPCSAHDIIFTADSFTANILFTIQDGHHFLRKKIIKMHIFMSWGPAVPPVSYISSRKSVETHNFMGVPMSPQYQPARPTRPRPIYHFPFILTFSIILPSSS